MERAAWKALIGKFPDVKYEPDKIPFRQPAKERVYIPDFKLSESIYIEAKGKLDLQTRQKMEWFRDCNPEVIIIFLFQNPSNKITKRSKTTYAEWSEKNGWYWLDFRRGWMRSLQTLLKRIKDDK